MPKRVYFTYQLPELSDFYPQVYSFVKEIKRKVYDEPYDEKRVKAIAYVVHNTAPLIRHSPYHEFLSDCLREEMSGKEDRTLADTQAAFKKCVLKWKEMKKQQKS
mgnify:FL=1